MNIYPTPLIMMFIALSLNSNTSYAVATKHAQLHCIVGCSYNCWYYIDILFDIATAYRVSYAEPVQIFFLLLISSYNRMNGELGLKK